MRGLVAPLHIRSKKIVQRVLITGASGFVGRHIVPVMVRAGYRVRAAARDTARVNRAGGVEIVSLPNLGGSHDWAPLLAEMDVVIHLAGIAHISSGVPAGQYDAVNRAATAALAKASHAAGIEHLIFVSSIRAQTGPMSDHVLNESDHPCPTDPYGRSKLGAEHDIRDSGVPYTILRPVVMYGPGAKGNVGTLLRIARLPVPLPFAGLDCRRSMLSIGNLASAIRFVLETPATAGGTFIVADAETLTLAEVIATLRQGMNRRVQLFRVPPALFSTSLTLIGRGDQWDRITGDLVVDAGKLRKAGWVPAETANAALLSLARTAGG